MLIFKHTQNNGYLKPQNNGELKKPHTDFNPLLKRKNEEKIFLRTNAPNR